MSFTSSYPTVVYITDTIDGIDYQGSGVLISPDEVLTASHVVYDDVGGEAYNITVTPDYNGSASPFGSAYGTRIHYNPILNVGFTLSPAQSEVDYAVIKLSQSFTGLGTMGIEADCYGQQVNVTGYPGIDGGAQITAPQSVTAYFPYSLYLGFSIGAGSSGGPVWVDTAGGPQVVGLVSTEDAAGDGFFTQITSAALSVIQSWEQQDAAACFLQGTRIVTVRGSVPVEALRVGDVVVARWGLTRVQWIGRRRVLCRCHPTPHDVWPVRIGAGAFGPGCPVRDLRLSPDHAVSVGGELTPVRHLINGASIVQEEHDSAVYWHVELPRHDLLLAEGLAVESYLDTGNRDRFTSVQHPRQEVATGSGNGLGMIARVLP